MTLAIVVGIVLGLGAVTLGGRAIVNTMFPRNSVTRPRGNSNVKEKMKKAVEELAKIPVEAIAKTEKVVGQSADLMNSFIAGKEQVQDNNRSR